MQQISKNVYAETDQPGCNPGFVTTKDGVVLIDTPQQPSTALKWRDDLNQKGGIRYVINTEHHRDHIMGNYFISAPIISHEKTREAFFSLTLDSVVEKVKTYDPSSLPLMEDYFLKMPSITFSENLTLYQGDHTFKLIHLPGHTAGMAAVYIPEERVVFTGDNIFHGVQTYLHQAYPEEWLSSLRQIGSLDVDVIVPGHGKICDKDYIGEQTRFIEEWMEAVKDAKRKGLSKEEAQGKISFIDRYPMDTGLGEERARQVQQMNVSRLYDML